MPSEGREDGEAVPSEGSGAVSGLCYTGKEELVGSVWLGGLGWLLGSLSPAPEGEPGWPQESGWRQCREAVCVPGRQPELQG